MHPSSSPQDHSFKNIGYGSAMSNQYCFVRFVFSSNISFVKFLFLLRPYNTRISIFFQPDDVQVLTIFLQIHISVPILPITCLTFYFYDYRTNTSSVDILYEIFDFVCLSFKKKVIMIIIIKQCAFKTDCS